MSQIGMSSVIRNIRLIYAYKERFRSTCLLFFAISVSVFLSVTSHPILSHPILSHPFLFVLNIGLPDSDDLENKSSQRSKKTFYKIFS